MVDSPSTPDGGDRYLRRSKKQPAKLTTWKNIVSMCQKIEAGFLGRASRFFFTVGMGSTVNSHLTYSLT